MAGTHDAAFKVVAGPAEENLLLLDFLLGSHLLLGPAREASVEGEGAVGDVSAGEGQAGCADGTTCEWRMEEKEGESGGYFEIR
jgi:hypothetical protein